MPVVMNMSNRDLAIDRLLRHLLLQGLLRNCDIGMFNWRLTLWSLESLHTIFVSSQIIGQYV